MGLSDIFLNPLLEKVAQRIGATVQSETRSQRHRDFMAKGDTYSVEAEIGEALADLMLMFSSAPVVGGSARAEWLDAQSAAFFRKKAKSAVSTSFVHGDVLVVPSWNGRNVQNVIVPAPLFEVLETSGDEATACAYVVAERRHRNTDYRLLQAVELVEYGSGGAKAYANRYRMFVAANDAIVGDGLTMFPDWAERYEQEWFVPNVDRLLVGRMKSPAVDPTRPNTVKGIPICYGAGEPIRQIHHLLDQMSVEFDLSEKAIMADKRLFQTAWYGDESHAELPRGRERLYMTTRGIGGEPQIHEWSPEIRYNAYLEAIDKQERLVERAVGVSPGIISSGNDINYQNIDNVRKGMQRTVAFMESARDAAESMVCDLVYAWDVLANYHGITPMGEHDLTFDWSDDYIETFGDMRDAIIAGEGIGATDAVDYRRWLYGETQEQAAERVAEIRATRDANPTFLMPV